MDVINEFISTFVTSMIYSIICLMTISVVGYVFLIIIMSLELCFRSICRTMKSLGEMLFDDKDEKQPKEKEKTIDLKKLDSYQKNEIIGTIKCMNPKTLNYENLNSSTYTFDIINTKLIPMSIEMYYMLYNKLGYQTNYIPKNMLKFKLMYKRPKFTTDVYMDTYDHVENHYDQKYIEERLKDETLQVEAPAEILVNKPFNSQNITLEEYHNSFNFNVNKKDVIGLKKKVYQELPKYYAQKVINEFNRIMFDTKKINEISFGFGTLIYKVSKKGELTDLKSFRQIVSIPAIVSIFHKILNIRLLNYMLNNKFIDTNIQKGGLPNNKQPILQQIYKIKSVINNAVHNKKQCCVLFLDIENAFGSVDLQNIFQVLRHYNVPEYFINYIKEYYNSFEYYITINKNKTETLKWKEGIIQGCPLSQLLFNIALNYILTKVQTTYQELSYQINEENFMFSAFVDDICSITTDVTNMATIFKAVQDEMKKFGLKLNKSKSALFLINHEDNVELPEELKEVRVTTRFKYLGTFITSSGKLEYFPILLKIVSSQLYKTDGKYNNNTDKINHFNGVILPFIKRKLLTLYDLDNIQKLKLASIVQGSLKKWGYNEDIVLFTDISDIINESDDKIIKKMPFKKTDSNKINQIISSDVQLGYSNINEDCLLEID